QEPEWARERVRAPGTARARSPRSRRFPPEQQPWPRRTCRARSRILLRTESARSSRRSTSPANPPAPRRSTPRPWPPAPPDSCRRR
ncbi:hypothetical protein DSP71_06850, partial [Microbacterium sp. H6]